MINVYEVFDKVSNAATDDERVDVLRKNDNYALRQILRGTYDPNIEFAITSVPYYKPSDSPAGLGYTSIAQELGRVYLFQKEHPKLDRNLTDKRREQILIQILEALETREAVVFMNMLLKDQKVNGLDAKIVKKAFPDIF